MPLSFSKEVVKDIVPKGSLLASALLSQAPREKQQEDDGVQIDEYLQNHQSPSDTFTVAHVIEAIVTVCAQQQPYLSEFLSFPIDSEIFEDPDVLNKHLANLALTVADDGVIDPDFPEIDGCVSINRVGVDQFILSQSSYASSSYNQDRFSMKPYLLVSIPEESISSRPTASDILPDLRITCLLPILPNVPEHVVNKAQEANAIIEQAGSLGQDPSNSYTRCIQFSVLLRQDTEESDSEDESETEGT